MDSRKKRALEGRIAAAKLAYDRPHPEHISNGDELKYRFEHDDELPARQGRASHIANYTKGLPHHSSDGLVCDPADYQKFIQGIDSGDPRDFLDTPLGPKVGPKVAHSAHDCDELPWQSHYTQTADKKKRAKEVAANKAIRGVAVRAWESEAAGNVFDLEGPDAQSVTMPPAPTLESDEYIAEVAEVYEMALLRDLPFSQFESHPKVAAAVNRLRELAWFNQDVPLKLSEAEQARRRVNLTAENAFRGTSVGDHVGPYLSQFLYMGTPELGDDNNPLNPLDGYVSYGAMRFDNKVRIVAERDFVTTWDWWLDVQNGADLRNMETYESTDKYGSERYRFIATPRDLATYVHYDALYQAYLNACLSLLSQRAPFDPGVPFQAADKLDHQQGFAHFGGPHILSLVTEVATRALKAVRYQKFSVHRRLRPEAIGGRIHRRCSLDNPPASLAGVDMLGRKLEKTLKEVAHHNREQNQKHLSDLGSGGSSEFGEASDVFLMPMAFPEGSPMHPSYGAGHATVAGACVTILKAFFDHGYVLPGTYVYSANGTQLDPVQDKTLRLTVEGELNKLAANIAIGRDWAGVHYFTDYYESLRLGEKIAIGILQEQKLTYGENFSMTVPLFGGGSVRI